MYFIIHHKNMNTSKTITDAEFEIMKILWSSKKPVSSAEIRRELLEQKSWEKSTVLTLLRRLKDKKVISVQKGDPTYYLPLISEIDYKAQQTQDMVDKLYGGSVKGLIAALCDSKLNADDMEELRKYFTGGEDQ